METAANIGDFGRLFRLIRHASGKHSSLEFNLRDINGHIIPNLDGKIERWTQHFSQLLNRPTTRQIDFDFSALTEPYNIDCNAPTEEEITEIISRLKNAKSPGEDGIPAEIYKACNSVLVKPLYKLFCSIWETEVFPPTGVRQSYYQSTKKETNRYVTTIEVSV